MEEALAALELRYEVLEARLADPAVYADPERVRRTEREIRELTEVVEAYRAWKRAEAERQEAEALSSDPDPEVRELAREEREAAAARAEALRTDLDRLLAPRDPDEDRDAVLEIRSGVGGEEAALFARSLLRMYSMYAQRRGWEWETVSLEQTELGGVRECSVLIGGTGAYARLKNESGVHRVQRVPETESGGRIHTSAATVAVLRSAEDVDVRIDPKDLKIDTFRSSGAGGQHVNKTDSAVRITHLPTGLVVECQDERSQYKNRDKAMKVLRSRLYERERRRRDADTAAERRDLVGSGDRSERVRTYNFPQGRVTDHRTGRTLYKIGAVMDGDLDELIDALTAREQAERWKER